MSDDLNYDKELADFINKKYQNLADEPLSKVVNMRDTKHQAVFAMMWEIEFCRMKLNDLNKENLKRALLSKIKSGGGDGKAQIDS